MIAGKSSMTHGVAFHTSFAEAQVSHVREPGTFREIDCRATNQHTGHLIWAQQYVHAEFIATGPRNTELCASRSAVSRARTREAAARPGYPGRCAPSAEATAEATDPAPWPWGGDGALRARAAAPPIPVASRHASTCPIPGREGDVDEDAHKETAGVSLHPSNVNKPQSGQLVRRGCIPLAAGGAPTC